MNVDLTAAVRIPDLARVRDWLSAQRIFISSAMADTVEERRQVAQAIEDEGARPVWFEELGRDADAQEAYLNGVDTSAVYVAVLNELYGRIDQSGFSATEAEYNRARERGLRIAAFIKGDAPEREGHLRQFIDRIRVFITTEDYSTPEDLDRRVRRRLHELAAEALSPWVKLNDLVFRADEIVDRGEEIVLTARTNDDIAHRLEGLRNQHYGRTRVRIAYGDRVADAEVSAIERTIRATGTAEVKVSLSSAATPQAPIGRAGTSGLSADDLVEIGLRQLFFGEEPRRDLPLMGLTRTGLDEADLASAFHLPNEVAGPVTRLVIAESVIGSGNALRLLDFQLGPAVFGGRQMLLAWEPPADYGNPAQRRHIEGIWRVS